MMTTVSPAKNVTPKSALFHAPGRPRPLARRLAVHNRTIERIRAFFRDEQFHEVPVTALADYPAHAQLEGMIARGFSAVWSESEIMPRGGKLEPRHLRAFKLIEISRQGLNLDELCGLAENLLKTVAADMTADLLGGMHVTRLDRMINSQHQRLTYDEALVILAAKGWDAADWTPNDGVQLPLAATATLTRHCGNLPFILTHLPVGFKLPGVAETPARPGRCESFQYILPYAGLTFDGSVRDAAGAPAGFSLDLGRLLQYLMGLARITDTLIDPMEKVALAMRGAPTDAGLHSAEGTE